MSDLEKRLAFNRYLPRHLSELNRVLKRNVRREELLGLPETEALLEKAKLTARAPGWKCEIPFEDKKQPRFQAFIHALDSLHRGGVYLWTPLANDCGLPPEVSMSEIDFDFPFDLNPEGIMEVLTDDFTQRLLLEYSREADREVLEIEVDGAAWRTAKY